MTTFETTTLGPFTVPRVWIGLWQLSSPAWGTASSPKIKKEMTRHIHQGFTAFADHYGSAEILFGQCRRALQSSTSSPNIVGATKWCIFRPLDQPASRTFVEDGVLERFARMGSDHIDILQIHWFDYNDPNCLATFRHLVDIRRNGSPRIPPGRIGALALCNFDSETADRFCQSLPGELVSNQVQFSLIDIRPLSRMAAVCVKHNLKLLTYGTLCGGFLADKWLGQPLPNSYLETITPSQRKYLDMINVWGNWDLFQHLLRVLRTIGDRHGGRSISNVATRWILDHPFVAAVIVGARLGVSEHTDDNAQVFSFHLTDTDRREIDDVLARSKGRELIHVLGDCGAEYR